MENISDKYLTTARVLSNQYVPQSFFKKLYVERYIKKISEFSKFLAWNWPL